VPLGPAELQLKGKTGEELVAILQVVLWRLEQIQEFRKESLEEAFRKLSERLAIKLRDLGKPFYVAIAGSEAAPPLFQSMEILGSDIVRMRLRRAIEALGGISGKKQKEVEKQFAEIYGSPES
jgi:glutamyl-tRNA synthetase